MGFPTGFDGAGRQVVMTRADDAPLPLGAALNSCGGIAAHRLAVRNVDAFRGRWQLASQRATQGGRLFLDAGNLFVVRPMRCRFVVAGKAPDVRLGWLLLPNADFEPRFAATAPRARPDFVARVLADGRRRFSLPGFEGAPGGKDATALVPMQVHRGHRRGNSEPARPVAAFTGDMRDTAASARWIARAPRSRLA